MIRSWSFTLANSSTYYNIWTLITQDSSFTDPTFTNAPFVPKTVKELVVQNQTMANLHLSDPKNESGFLLTNGQAKEYNQDTAIIDLSNFNLKSDTASTVVFVGIVA